MGTPATRTITLGTAFQATVATKPAAISLTLTSTAQVTLGGSTAATADIVIGATSGVATGTGTVIGRYANSMGGTVIIGVGVNTTSTTPFSFMLPIGWWFAVRQTAGTITVASCFDQAVG